MWSRLVQIRGLLRVSRRRSRGAAILVSLSLLVGAGIAGFSGGGRSYTVQPGDSLWAISQANGLTVAQLAAANDINPNNLLLIGRVLYIPGSESSTGGGAAAMSSSPSSAGNPWTFCSTFTPDPGPWGLLPQLLRQSPNRLALQPLYVKWADYYDLSLPLLEAIGWQESGWQQNVVSSTGAVGAGQIMPGTARFIMTYLIGRHLDINSVSDNIRMSAAFLAYLAGIEGNNRCHTIAAYYEGPLNLAEYGVFPESEAYVASVEALIPRFE